MKKTLFKTDSGVKINFQGVVKRENILKMVDNCITNGCDCMSDQTKKKISNMEVNGEDGSVELNISGEITTEEIKEAMAKSKVLNG